MMHYMEVVPYVTIARPYLHLIPVCIGSKLIIVVNLILSVQPYLTLISRSYQPEVFVILMKWEKKKTNKQNST
jgi:hypothetical protein